jgi:hypothetical protein
MEYRGLGGVWEPGPVQRAMDEVTNYDVQVNIDSAPGDPRNTTINTTGNVDFSVNVASYAYGTPALPIAVTVVATGVGGWTQAGNITVLGTPFTFNKAILVGDDWTVTVTTLDANNVPGNPVYTFHVTRPV